jgi:outer membrane protein assembly factor BamB
VGSSSAQTQIFVRKYSRSGTELWTREFGSTSYDSAFSAAFDKAGNTYLAGYADGALPGQNLSGFEDAFAAKIDSQGTILWITQMGKPGGNYANNIAFDSSGDAYVTGYLNNDGFVTRLDGATGKAVWQVTLPNAGAFTEGTDVAVSKSGIYVAYELAGETSSDALIRKYGFDATELWSNRIPGGGFGNAGMRHLLLNARGDVYSVLEVATTGGSRGAVRKLDASGVEQWTVTIGAQNTDQPLDSGLDPMGNLWLHFTEYGTYPGQTSKGAQDMALVELDASGHTLFAVQYGSPGNDFPSIPKSLLVGHAGQVYVASTVQGSVNGQPYLGMQDCLLIKFAAPRVSRTGGNRFGLKAPSQHPAKPKAPAETVAD